MKRFYKLVSIHEGVDGWEVHLDGRPVRTPFKAVLRAQTAALAEALQQEWAAQRDLIRPDTMPLTQILCTRIDKIPAERAAMTAALMNYLDTDLLCYRAAQPEALALAQEESWDRWLLWFAGRFSVALLTTLDLKALNQPAAAHQAARAYLEGLSADELTIVQIVTPLSGSLVLALALVARAAGAEDVFKAMRVEETYKALLYDEDKYGPDPAQEKKDQGIVRDLEAAERYLGLISA